MLIKEIGGEFALLQRILKTSAPKLGHNEIIVPNGDDCAVLKIAGRLLAITTDSVIEDVHFSFKYFTLEQVGRKAIETSASDIIAMRGMPKYVLVALALPDNFTVEQCEQLYNGIYAACGRIGLTLIGGDTSMSQSGVIINVTVLGEVESEAKLCKRSGALPGENIYVSGLLGLSAAGLLLLQKGASGFENLKRKHLEPECRLDLLESLPSKVGAMIDISDGLASELEHIARSSKCKLVIDEEVLNVEAELLAACKTMGLNPYDLIYSGGEDYELLYTASSANQVCPGYKIGEVQTGSGVFVRRGNKTEALANKGYVHFKI